MKKLLFLLLFLLWGTGGLFAAVTVTPLSVAYSAQKVTFRVEWTGAPANGRVWVWVDYCSVTGTSPGTFEKAVISGATATVSGSIATVSGNTRGFYVTANPSTVTATLSNAPVDKFNWCVYGSDAPPNVTVANGTYTLHGSPPFTLIAANGTTTQTVAATTIATSAVTVTPVTLTDETGYPGDFCIYSGSDLFIDGTHLCQQRASGAKNWEAHIRDSRDNNIYKVILMPNNEWWFADYLDYVPSGIATTVVNGLRYYTAWPACPDAWTVWDVTKAKSLITTYGGTNLSNIKSAETWGTNYTGNDYYGLNVKPTCVLNNARSSYSCGSNNFALVSGLTTDYKNGINGNAWSDSFDPWVSTFKCQTYPCAPVRCYRQL